MSSLKVTPEELRRAYALPETDDDLLAECDVSAFKSSGPGGQHKNTTLSSIRLQHRPSGLVVIGRRERSQKRNLDDALGRLRQKLAELLIEPKTRKRTKPTQAARRRRLDEKRRRAEVKRGRTRPDSD
jgi:ribosome-associated protein